MAKFSQQFLANLGRPQMAESLFGLGATIGGLPGQAKDQRKKQEFNQLMQQIQGAQGSGDFTSMKTLAQQLARTNPEQAAKVMQAATALEQKQGQQKALEGLFTGEVQTPEALMTAGQQALAAGDPQTALALRDKAQGLSKTEATRQSETAAIQQELQGYMTNPEASPEVKRMANQIYRGFVGGGMQPAAIAQQLSALRDLAKPRAVGSRAAPKEVEVMEKQPDGSMKRVTKFALQDPVTGELTYERVGLTPPKEFAPSGPESRGEVPAAVEKKMIEISAGSTKAGNLLSRNRSLRDSLYSGEAKLTGVLSDLRTSALTFAGMRDKEEEDKTLFLKNRNTDIINSLPPGVASDKDIEIFSAGFPQANASREEILNYLAAEERILASQQDMSLIFEQHLGRQITTGQTATTVGYESRRQAYGIYMGRALNAMEEEKERNPAQAIEIEKRYSKQMQEDLGFVPSYYR
jgi:hypothetical protein